MKENASKTTLGQLNTVPEAFRITQIFIKVMRKFDLAYNQTSYKDKQRYKGNRSDSFTEKCETTK